MVELKIDLSNYTDRFSEDSKLVLDKNVNFVFGKNWTWKSTIRDLISEQYKDNYDIRIYKWFQDYIKEEKPLEAFTLWVKNVEVKKKIEIINSKISEIAKNIDETSEENTLWKKYKDINKKVEQQEGKMVKFYSNSASLISNMTDPQISPKTYQRNNFKDEIKYAHALSIAEMEIFEKIIRETEKDEIKNIKLIELNWEWILQQVNNIITKSLKPTTSIEELDNDAEKQNFAKLWLKVHHHKTWEKCAFCWNIIDEERWKILENYFNNEVYDIEDRINQLINTIEEEKNNLNNQIILDKSQFYDKFINNVTLINNEINSIKLNYIKFFDDMIDSLQKKKSAIFTSHSEVEYDIPKNFSHLQLDVNSLIEENNNFSKNLKSEKEEAREKLRYHYIQQYLNWFDYENEKKEANKLQWELKSISDLIEIEKTKIRDLEQEKKTYLWELSNEQAVEKKINDCLAWTWHNSFKIVHVPNEWNIWKWQYQVFGNDGKLRPITKLSDWEKNIIAFLYFYYKLEESDNGKNKIIILDDPMNSNDDTMQYLMTTKICEIYNEMRKSDIFILLTHNLHFYLNVRPFYDRKLDNNIHTINKKVQKIIDKIDNINIHQNQNIDKLNLEENISETYYEKKHYYKLIYDWVKTTIVQIKNHDDDYESNYHVLWDDLLFLFDNDKPQTMINNCRRILESFINFYYNWIIEFDENKETKKLYDVNSHWIRWLEDELNWKTKEQIIWFLNDFFKNNHIDKHFDIYTNNRFIPINQQWQEQN